MDKNRIVSSLIWKYIEQIVVTVARFVIGIVLARILSPDEFGLVALASIVLNISVAITEGGLGSALVQKREIDKEDSNTIFTFSFVVAIVFYTAIFFAAPWLAEYFNEPLLTSLIRVMGVTLIISAVQSVAGAMANRRMLFKQRAHVSVVATVISGSIGIYMAYNGFGVWTLVYKQIIDSVVILIALLFLTKWWPRLRFSYKRFKPLFGYGWKILTAGLLDMVYNELSGVVIGRKYTSAMLGYYNKGKSFPLQILNGVNATLQSVIFPAFSAFQTDKTKSKALIRRSIKLSTYLIFPIMLGMAAIAKPIVIVLLTEKWLPSVPYIQLFCLIYAFQPIHIMHLQLIKGQGRSDIYLRLDVVKKIIGISLLFILAQYGVIYIAVSYLAVNIISLVINAYPSTKIIDYKFKEQIMDVLPNLIKALVMAAVVVSLSLLNLSELMLVISQIATGIIVYVGLSVVFKDESWLYYIDTIMNLINKRRKRSQEQ